MTEADWNSCTDPQVMLPWLRASGKLTERKARLFAVACCRHIWPLLTDARSRQAVEAAEVHADEPLTFAELVQFYLAARTAGDEATVPGSPVYPGPAYAAVTCVSDEPLGCSPPAAAAASNAVFRQTGWEPEARAAWDEQYLAHCHLLRCIVGPMPFRPVDLEPSWRTPNVLALARWAYEERNFTALPVLADALEEAGCGQADVLSHLRGPEPHARGCWAVDAVLGKE